MRGVNATSTPGSSASSASSALSNCASCPWSSRPWAGRPWRCSSQLDAACQAADELAAACAEAFHQHPDAAIITSFPGLAACTGARVLAEIGDDRSRFTDARSLKAYAGAAPVTRASGKSRIVMHRKVKNQRLAAAGYVWAFAALKLAGRQCPLRPPRAVGDRHASALRNMFNRMLGQLHHCLVTGRLYDQTAAFPGDDDALGQTAA